MRCAAVFADRHKPHIWSECAVCARARPTNMHFQHANRYSLRFLARFVRSLAQTYAQARHTHSFRQNVQLFAGFHEQSTFALYCGMQSASFAFVLLLPMLSDHFFHFSLITSFVRSFFLPLAALCWRCRVLDRSQLNVLNWKHPIHAYTIDCSEQN